MRHNLNQSAARGRRGHVGPRHALKIASVSVALALAAGWPGHAAELHCTFQSRFACEPRGCTPADPSASFVVLRLEDKLYGRCGGGRPCDWFPMTVQANGAYLHLDFAAGALGAKVSADGERFIETVGLLDMLFVGFGSCRR